MKILYKFPTRSRRNKMLAAIDNITALAKHDDYVIQLTLDVDDESVTNNSVKHQLAKYGKVYALWGISAGSKIGAVNRDLGLIFDDFDILICMSDDFVFLQEGFDLQIISDMQQYFPDGDGFLHYPDGHVNERLATMSIIGRKYFERFGYIYHPEYKSVYCDQEAQEVAKKLGKYKYIPIQLFEHQHPVWKRTEWDEQYRKTEDPVVYAEDKATYLRRQSQNFDLPIDRI
jgi:hypothetical protein